MGAQMDRRIMTEEPIWPWVLLGYSGVEVLLLFFSSRRRHTRYWRDWSSDVCSSDLAQCRLLAFLGDDHFDRLFDLRERRLRPRLGRQHLVDVVAELRLQRPAQLVDLRREQRVVEVLLLGAFDRFRKQAPFGLAGGVDRDLLRDAGEALAAFDFLLRRLRLRFGLRQDD